MSNDLENDFGISFDGWDAEVEETEKALEDSLKELYNLVQPLLAKLTLQPEKATIKWPERAQVAQDLLDKLTNVYERALRLKSNGDN